MGCVWSSIVCLRFFTNDRGQMIIERGTEKLRLSPGKLVAIRALAATAIVQLIMFAFYNVPNSMIAMKPDRWPPSLQKRSYFLNGLCGQGTGRLCPGPGIPHDQGNSAYINANGNPVIPPESGFRRNHIIPLLTGK
jgi:hypothetical protein